MKLSVSCMARFLLSTEVSLLFILKLKKIGGMKILSDSSLILAPFGEDLYFFPHFGYF